MFFWYSFCKFLNLYQAAQLPYFGVSASRCQSQIKHLENRLQGRRNYMKFKHLLIIISLLTASLTYAQTSSIVTIKKVASVTAISAVCVGNSECSTNIQEQGVCWSTSSNPTINDNRTSNGTAAGKFIARIYGLEENTTYYIKGYMKTNSKTIYSDEMTFTTPAFPEGAVKGVFSIGETKQVLFSQGNLQYQASTGTWRFAENQYDFVGDDIRGNVMENGVKCDNSLIAPNYDGWIDLFGWGTSGWDNGNVFYHPYDNDCKSIDADHGFGYGPTHNNSYFYNLTGENSKADWGIFNAISNGGNQPNQWKTLSNDEFYYLMKGRDNAKNKCGPATVCGVYGFVILPDNWETPDELDFEGYDVFDYTTNVYETNQWAEMENRGAVFLPLTGYRQGVKITNLVGQNKYGEYWTSTYDALRNASDAYYICFYASYGNSSFSMQSKGSGAKRYFGFAVRLVTNNN